jgi:hypothetical protein
MVAHGKRLVAAALRRVHRAGDDDGEALAEE